MAFIPFPRCEVTGSAFAQGVWITELGPIRSNLALCLLVAWVLVTISLIWGVQSLGKVHVYVEIG